MALVIGTPTMRWIIASGLLHNFIMYAFTFFLPSFLVRYHRTTLQAAGLTSALVVGTVGALGMLAGGWLGDSVLKLRPNGRMLTAGSAALLAVPAGLLALLLPSGSLTGFIMLQRIAAFLMYTYYPNVYATIHDVIEPALRGRAMAIYFFVMYMLGASMGPVATGWLSDFLARRSARFAGVPLSESFRAQGLHQAMFLIPLLTLVLSSVLFAGARTSGMDARNLQQWMKKLSGKSAEEAKIAEKE
jgi:MFS family permease